jgi:non-specific serine/threonine protein kinase
MRTINFLALRQGEYAEARAWAERALEVAQELGDKWEIARSYNNLAISTMMQGDYNSARALFEACLAGYRELGKDEYIHGILTNLGELARYQGDFALAVAYYRESLGRFRAVGEKIGAMVTAEGLGYAEYHLGRFEEARATLLEGLALARETESMMHVATILASLGGAILAEIALPGVQDISPRSGARPAGMERATRLFGVSAELLERTGKQLEPIEQDEYERNVASARALLGEQSFTKAWDEGRAMTLDQALQLATQELDARSGAQRRTSRQLAGGLTPREYEVAGLVTQGMSNEDIARTLVLSERTVEMHVSNALQKLGLSTRTQLAAWALEQGLREAGPS